MTGSCEHDNELGIPENAVKSFDEELLASKVGPCSLELDGSMDGLTQIDRQTESLKQSLCHRGFGQKHLLTHLIEE